MRPTAGGGWHAVAYSLQKARQSGGFLRMWQALRTRNACKTCALGMGGQAGGMVNEAGHFPEVCKKSVQAMAADLQPALPADHLAGAGFAWLEGLSSRQLEHLGRLTVPLVAGPEDSGYRAVSWDEAIDRLGAGLTATTPERSFFYFSGRSSNEAGFLLQLFARVYGTNNVNNCSFYCHQASGVGLGSVLGSGTATVQLDDIDHADLVLLIGANPASNHPRLMRSLMQLKRRGGRVVVVNPARELGLERFSVPSDVRSLLFGSTIADRYVQPHIGGDIAFLTAVARRIIALGAVDRGFLAEHTTGWPALEAHLAAQDDADLERRSGVSATVVDEVAAWYAQSKATIFVWAMGITHHLHGVGNVKLIADLSLLRGMTGRPGAGLLPLRGHSNIQGLGTVGVAPQLKEAVLARLESHFGISVPTAKGLDTMQSMERAHAGGIAVAWCLGGNLFGSNPDAVFAKRALGRIGQVVYLNTTLNTGHVHGRGQETWILPVLARDEEPQPTTQESMFSFVRLSDGGPPRHLGPKSEVQVIAALARRVLGDRGPIDWAALEAHGQIRAAIAAVVPGLEALATIDRTRQEFHIPGRAVHDARFATADGRAQLAVVPLPPAPTLGERQLRVMTVRSEGQFNTVVYEDHDRYRSTDRRDVILISAEDRVRLGLTVDQRITVRSSVGAMAVRVREFAIRPGNALMYYPEANVLVERAVDPESGTPAFKNVVVTVEA